MAGFVNGLVGIRSHRACDDRWGGARASMTQHRERLMFQVEEGFRKRNVIAVE